jgi:hypothetical protein
LDVCGEPICSLPCGFDLNAPDPDPSSTSALRVLCDDVSLSSSGCTRFCSSVNCIYRRPMSKRAAHSVAKSVYTAISPVSIVPGKPVGALVGAMVGSGDGGYIISIDEAVMLRDTLKVRTTAVVLLSVACCSYTAFKVETKDPSTTAAVIFLTIASCIPSASWVMNVRLLVCSFDASTSGMVISVVMVRSTDCNLLPCNRRLEPTSSHSSYATFPTSVSAAAATDSTMACWSLSFTFAHALYPDIV